MVNKSVMTGGWPAFNWLVVAILRLPVGSFLVVFTSYFNWF